MADIPSHHLIYGMCTDFVTGESVVDTDDERYRQKLARLLVEEKGYARADLEMRVKIETLFAKQFVVSTIDFIVRLKGKRFMVIRYGPGSLVTRERPAIAAALQRMWNLRRHPRPRVMWVVAVRTLFAPTHLVHIHLRKTFGAGRQLGVAQCTKIS